MILKPARLIVALLALSAVPAFAQVAATVNGKPIPNSKIDLIVKQAVAQGKQTDTPQLREAIKRDLISREVLIQEADKQGFGNRPEVKAALDNARQNIIITAMLADHVRKSPISDADVRAEFDRIKAQVGDKEYHARHILVEKEDEAKGIIAKLKAGSKFEDLAKAHGKDGTAPNGGDLNWAGPHNFVPEFSKAMVELKKGAISETPVRTEHGFHVIKLEDVRAAKPLVFEEVRQQVVERMQQRKVAQFREDLMKKAKIQMK